jgi:hypothetical protein
MNIIAKKNDELRKFFPKVSSPHRVWQSKAVCELSLKELETIFERVRKFSDFDINNDPYGERDFISIDLNGETYFLKIDYYDDDFKYFKENGNRGFHLFHSSEY